MYKNIFHNQLKIKSDKSIDARMFIDELSEDVLKLTFEDDGKYSYDNAVVFNKSDKSFYYLTRRLTPADSIVPTNWSKIQSAANGFVLYAASSIYSVGDCVYQQDAGLNNRFFIAREPIAVSESPLTTPSKWLEVSGAGASSTWQVSRHRVNPELPGGTTTRTFEVEVSSALISGHNPVVTVYVNIGNSVNGNASISKIEPKIEYFLNSGVYTLQIEFSGDLSDFVYDPNDSTQTNITVEIR